MTFLFFLKRIFLKSPIKTIMLIVFLVLLYPDYHLKDITNTKIVRSVFMIKDNHSGPHFYYVIDKGGETAEYTVEEFSEKQKIVPDSTLTDDVLGRITYTETHPGIFWSIGVQILFGILLIIGAFMDDSDINWSFKNNWYIACARNVSCEEEEGVFYYRYKDRLLVRQTHQIHIRDISHYIELFYEDGDNLYPEFANKAIRRHKLLKDLFPD